MAKETELINKLNAKLYDIENKQFHFKKGTKVNIPIKNKYVSEKADDTIKKYCSSCKDKFNDFEWDINTKSPCKDSLIECGSKQHHLADEYIIENTAKKEGIDVDVDANYITNIAKKVLESLKDKGIDILDSDDKNYELGYFDGHTFRSKSIANIYFYNENNITLKLNPQNLINFVTNLKTNINHLYLKHNNY